MSETPNHRATNVRRRQLRCALARQVTPRRLPGTLVVAAVVVALAGAVTASLASAFGVATAAATAAGFAASAATLSAGGAAYCLIRLAIRLHTRGHAFGPCRGAGYFGLGSAFTAATAATGGALALASQPAAATIAAQVGAACAGTAYVIGLLLLPGAAPTVSARLRHGLDGFGVGSAAFLVVWLLVLAPPYARTAPGVPVGVGLLGSIAVAISVITGLRAIRHRRAALACAAGAALVIAGLTLTAIGRPEPGWLVASGLAMAAGPPLILAGAGRAVAGPAGRAISGPPDGLAAQPLLALPVIAAICAAGYHAFVAGRFDRVAIFVGLGLVLAVAVRETLAALDVRRYGHRLAAQHARFRALVAGSGDVTMVLDGNLVVRWQSPAAARQFGLSDQDVLDRPFGDLVHPDDTGPVAHRLAAALAGERVGEDEDPPVPARLRDGFGSWRDTESTVRDLRAAPDVGSLVVHVRDVGDRTGLQRRLDEATRTDPLTGLPNERRLVELAGTRLATGARGALAVVDLHGLAGVGELFGTAVGDEVLVLAAERLQAAAEHSDVVVRLPGDRFAVLTGGSALRAYPRALRLVAAVTETYPVSAGQARLTANAGVADLNGAAHADEVLRHAATAAERARERGPGRVEGYDDCLATALRRRAAIEQALALAIRGGDFDLVYQPVVDLRHGKPLGVEALLRWRLPGYGPVPPAEVVAAAEELGCVDELDTRVLRRACRQLARWRHDGYRLTMAVNVSPRNLVSNTLPALVRDALTRNDVSPANLVVEVASRDLPEDDTAVAPLAALRSMGVRVGLDHFGSGALGLAHLPRLPVDLVKVDRSLFADRSAGLIDVVVGLGERFGFDVSAVGVESDSDLTAVFAAGCRIAQGHHLAPPSHAERVEAFLEERRARLL
jgi:diguanylate cyclase (GGDEF)-like protein/PAS domain S-box-containing protein